MKDQQAMKFTKSFCECVREGPLDRETLVHVAKIIRTSPILGKETIEGCALVRHHDFVDPIVGSLRWHYLFLPEDSCVISVYLTPVTAGQSAAFDSLEFIPIIVKALMILLDLA